MVFGAVFAGGSGSRMGNSDVPKQYLPLGDKPILVHALEQFLAHPEIDLLLVLCPSAWLGRTRDLLEEHLGRQAKIVLLPGGEERNDTLENALNYIETEYPAEKDAVIVTHDAVRPFLTRRIISENIAAARRYGACGTVLPATDTIVRSGDGAFIDSIPPRDTMYQAQTPQSFQVAKLRRVLDDLSREERGRLTDACAIFTVQNEPVHLVRGEAFNLKITYAYDLKLAKILLEKGLTCPDD